MAMAMVMVMVMVMVMMMAMVMVMAMAMVMVMVMAMVLVLVKVLGDGPTSVQKYTNASLVRVNIRHLSQIGEAFERQFFVQQNFLVVFHAMFVGTLWRSHCSTPMRQHDFPR